MEWINKNIFHRVIIINVKAAGEQERGREGGREGVAGVHIYC